MTHTSADDMVARVGMKSLLLLFENAAIDNLQAVLVLKRARQLGLSHHTFEY